MIGRCADVRDDLVGHERISTCHAAGPDSRVVLVAAQPCVSGFMCRTSPVDPRFGRCPHLRRSRTLTSTREAEPQARRLFSSREDIRRVSHYEMGRIHRGGPGKPSCYLEDLISKLDLESVRAAAFKVVTRLQQTAAVAMVLPQISARS